MRKPVYFVCYEQVWKMSMRRAQQFASACITGEGSTYADSYGKRVRKKVSSIDSDGYDTCTPAQSVIDWCSSRGYHCYQFTDFDQHAWRRTLACLQTNEPDYDVFGESA